MDAGYTREFPLTVLLATGKGRFSGLNLLCAKQQAHERSCTRMRCVLEWPPTVELLTGAPRADDCGGTASTGRAGLAQQAGSGQVTRKR
jgi:hypothetical protein